MRRMTFNAAELDKFVILSGEFSFQDEILEHVSQDKLFSKIIEVIGSQRPVLIFDKTNIELYVGNTDEDIMYLTALYNNSGNTYTLTYNRDTDQLRIEQDSKNFISEDNVKTLFGNQSIIGTGNIDLYRHDITIMSTLSITVYSSSNLKIDSVQDLTTVLKPYVGLVLGGVWYDKLNGNSEIAGYGALIYKSDNLWYMLLSTTESNIPVDSVTDVVTTI